MKYSFTTRAVIGAVLAVTGNAIPISQSSPSRAASTPFFSPEYTVVAGTFTAMAASPSTPLAPSSPLDLSGFTTNFGLGSIVPQSGIPEVSTTASTVFGTPTTMTATGSPIASPTPGFHPKLGHGPVVPGKGFNNSKASNSTRKHKHKPELTPPVLQMIAGPSLDYLGDNRCKYASFVFMCEKWAGITKWWVGRHLSHAHNLKKHPAPPAPSNPVQRRWLYLTNATAEATPGPSSVPIASNQTSSTAEPSHKTLLNESHALYLDHEIRHLTEQTEQLRQEMARENEKIFASQPNRV